MRLFIADELYYKIAFTTTSMFIFLGFYYYYLKDIELNFFLKIYRRITFINIIFFIFQEISYTLLGYRFIGVLTSLPLTLGRGEIDVNSYVQTLTEHSRSSAFFSEPAHFAQFLLPILVLEIFCSNSRYKNWYSLIYIVTLLLLRSGNGFFGLIIIIVFYLFHTFKKYKYKALLLSIPLLLIVSLTAIKYLQTEQGEMLLDRSIELDAESTGSSGFLRIYRGYFVYESLSTKAKIFGINSKKGTVQAIKDSPIAFAFGDNDTYFNAIQEILIQTGIVGIIIMLVFFIDLWIKSNIGGKCLLIILITLSFMASIYFTHTMILYLICITLMRNNKRKMEYYRITIAKNG